MKQNRWPIYFFEKTVPDLALVTARAQILNIHQMISMITSVSGHCHLSLVLNDSIRQI